MPVWIAASGDGVAEDVVWMLTHAKVGEDQGLAIHLCADKTAGKPLQALRGGNVAGLPEGGIVGRMKGEFDRAVVGDDGIEAFKVPVFGPRNDSPEQSVERAGRDKERRVLESARGEGLACVGRHDGFGGP